MTATDELRRLLDERGVKCRYYFHTNKTWWSGRENVGWYAEDRPNANCLYVRIEAVLTPAQAIAATLGVGTCHEVEDEDTGLIVCSECGAVHDEDYTNYYCWCCGRKVVDE